MTWSTSPCLRFFPLRFDCQWWKFWMGLNVMGKLEWISGYKIEWILISWFLDFLISWFLDFVISWFRDFFLSGNVDQYEDHIAYAFISLVIVCLKILLSVMTSPSMACCCIILHLEYQFHTITLISTKENPDSFQFSPLFWKSTIIFFFYDFQTLEFP